MHVKGNGEFNAKWHYYVKYLSEIKLNFQVIWVCMLCRKKQELLSKTGQWIHKPGDADGFMRPIGGVSNSYIM